jgi:hypothetical protein
MFESIAQAMLDSSLNSWIQTSPWIWPFLEIMHFIGLALLMGGLIVFDLRLAGHFRVLNLTAAHALLPLVLTGFAINLSSGSLFFYGDPLVYAANIGFRIKMGLIVLAGLNALLYYWKIKPLMHDGDANAKALPIARFVAYASLILWSGVLLFGRLLPYVGSGTSTG